MWNQIMRFLAAAQVAVSFFKAIKNGYNSIHLDTNISIKPKFTSVWVQIVWYVMLQHNMQEQTIYKRV